MRILRTAAVAASTIALGVALSVPAQASTVHTAAGTSTTAACTPSKGSAYFKISNISKVYKNTNKYSAWKKLPGTVKITISKPFKATGKVTGKASNKPKALVKAVREASGTAVAAASSFTPLTTYRYSEYYSRTSSRHYGRFMVVHQNVAFSYAHYTWKKSTCSYKKDYTGTGYLPRTADNKSKVVTQFKR